MKPSLPMPSGSSPSGWGPPPSRSRRQHHGRVQRAAGANQRSVRARNRRCGHLAARRGPRVRRAHRHQPGLLCRRHGDRSPHRHDRGQRPRPADAALSRSAVHPPGAAQHSGERRHVVRGAVSRTGTGQHDRHFAARGGGPGDAARRQANRLADGRRLARDGTGHELLVRRLPDARWARTAGRPDAWPAAPGVRGQRRRRLRAPQPRAVRLLPDWLRTDPGRPHRPAAPHQAAGAAPRARRPSATHLRSAVASRPSPRPASATRRENRKQS